MGIIKNVIFDLGGVILNIDFAKTNEAFHTLGLPNFSTHINQFHITDLFLDYETGKIDDVDFVEQVASLTETPMPTEKVIDAWNALLLEFPRERIDLLKKIKPKFRTFLLSNTNSIHLKEYQQRLYREQGVYLEDLFEKTYYSHVVKMRKPGAEIFELVLKENNLVPEETLFIDDTHTNLPEAEKLGIQTLHLKHGMSITDIELFR